MFCLRAGTSLDSPDLSGITEAADEFRVAKALQSEKSYVTLDWVIPENMRISKLCRPSLGAKILAGAAAWLALAFAACAAQTKAPARPQAFAPAPSSLILLLAGLVALAGWNWWRRRSRGVQDSRD
jgi:hypothetical protein